MPEGDSLHRAARRLQVLVGQRLEVEAPNPGAAVLGIHERLHGRTLQAVDAVGKNLLLHFEGGLVLRSHLRMRGRWWVGERTARVSGRPWLVLRGRSHQAVQWNGPVLELRGDVVARLGPDILATPPDLDTMVGNLRAAAQALPFGQALLRQRLVAGIGNMWMAEALWQARLSPWTALGDLSDAELREALASAAGVMRASLARRPPARRVYRRAGRPCPRCGTPIRSRGQGDANRTTYWCPTCQPARSSGRQQGEGGRAA